MPTYSGEQDINRLRPVKIHFKDKDSDEKGFYTLMVSGMPVQALPDQNYVVNKIQVGILQEKGIKYEEIT